MLSQLSYLGCCFIKNYWLKLYYLHEHCLDYFYSLNLLKGYLKELADDFQNSVEILVFFANLRKEENGYDLRTQSEEIQFSYTGSQGFSYFRFWLFAYVEETKQKLQIEAVVGIWYFEIQQLKQLIFH